MKLTREKAAVISMRNACARIADSSDTSSEAFIRINDLDPAAFIVKTDSVHVAKPLAESAVAPGECGSVPDTWKALYVCVNHMMAELGRVGEIDTRYAVVDKVMNALHAIDGGVVSKRAMELHEKAFMPMDQATDLALREMQPPNNQQNLICKSCGIDRSKEYCKGDLLRCGLASIAYSDHVAVTSAKPDSVHLAEPAEIIRVVKGLLAAQRQDSDKLVVVHKFLLGEGPLDGFYFGDSDTRRPRPAFWWRKYLRAAIANGAPK